MIQLPSVNRVLFSRIPRYLALGLFFVVFILLNTFLSTPKQSEAATSSNLNYQARLFNANGSTVPDGYYNIQFKLYNVSSGGTALWTESYYDSNGATAGNDNRLRVVNGYMSVNLGSQTAFPSMNWDQDMWLTINIGGSTQTATPTYDGEMTPRIKLTAVPYAFQAKSAEGLNELQGSYTGTLDFTTLTGNQSILLPDASGTVCLQGSTACNFAASSGSGNYIQNGTTPQTANFNITGTGTAGKIVLSSASTSNDILQGTASDGSTLVKIRETSGGSGSITIHDNAGASRINLDGGSGSILFGSSEDTNLYRFNANELATDDLLRVLGGSDAAPGSGGRLVIGGTGGNNIAIDDNEIMARSNGATATLFLNNDGGLVQIGSGGLSVSGAIQSTGNINSGGHLSLLGSSGNTSNAVTKTFICTTAVSAGDVVYVDTTTAGNVRNNPGGDNSTLVVGVATAGVSAGATCNIAISGVAQVNVLTSPAVAVGDTLTATPGTPGYAQTNNNATIGIIGKAISNKNASTVGQVYVLIQPVNGQYNPIFRNLNGDSSTAFQIQNAAGTSLFTADTNNGRIAIGSSTPANSILTIGGNTTSSAGGITFGTDTSLFRAGVNTLKTESDFLLNASRYLKLGSSEITQASSGALAVRALDGNNNLLLRANQDAYIVIDGDASGTNASFKVVRDAETSTNTLLNVDESGQLSLPGQGSSAGLLIGGDTNLYRSTTNTLKTDDNLSVGGFVDIQNGLQINSGIFNTPYGGFGWGSNNLTNSEAFNTWTAESRWTVTANNQTAPDTTTTAETIAHGNTGNPYLYQCPTTSSIGSNTFTYSVWLKGATGGETVPLRLESRASSCTTTQESFTQNVTLTNQWQRYSVTAPFNATSASSTQVLAGFLDNSATTYTMYAWGGQLERSSQANVYIETGSTAVTSALQGAFVNNALYTGGNGVQPLYDHSGSIGGVNSRYIGGYFGDSGVSANGINTTGNLLYVNRQSGATTTTNTLALLQNAATNTTTDGIEKYGMKIVNSGNFTGSTGSNTINYGLYVDAGTGADSNFGIYSASGTNYYAGPSQFGSVASIDAGSGYFRGAGITNYNNTGAYLTYNQISNGAAILQRDTAAVALTIRGAASQSANLLEIQTSAAANLLSVSSTGAVLSKNSSDSTSAFQIQNALNTSSLTYNTTDKKLVLVNNNLSAGASETALELSNGTNSTQFWIGNNGSLTIVGENSNTNQDISILAQRNLNLGTTLSDSINLGRTDTNIATTVNGTALFKTAFSNSTNAFQIQNSSSTALFNVNTSANSGNGILTLGANSSSSVVLNGAVTVSNLGTSANNTMLCRDGSGVIVACSSSSNGTLGYWTLTGTQLAPANSGNYVQLSATDFNSALNIKGTTASSTRSANISFIDNQATPQSIIVRKDGDQLILIGPDGLTTDARLGTKGAATTFSSDLSVGTTFNNRYFSDGFESGNMNQYTSANGVTVDSTVKRNGNYSAKVETNNNQKRFYPNINASSLSTVFTRAYVYPTAHSSGNLTFVTISNNNGIYWHELYRQPGTGYLCASNGSGLGGGPYCSTTVVPLNQWSKIDFEFTASTTTGTFKASLNDTQVINTTGVNNGGNTISTIFLGEGNTNRVGTYYMDDVAISSSAPGYSSTAKIADSLYVGGTSNLNGAVLLQPSINSPVALQIQNSAGTSNLLIADTVNTRVGIGAVPATSLLTIGTNTTALSGGLTFGTDSSIYRSGTTQLTSNANFIAGSHANGSLFIGDVGYGSTGSGYAGLAHSAQVGLNSYALLQSATGYTMLNGASGQGVAIRVANSDIGVFTANGSTFSGDVSIYKNSAGALGPKLSLTNSGGGCNAQVSLDMSSYSHTTPTSRILVDDDCNYSSSMYFQTKTPGATSNALGTRFGLEANGSAWFQNATNVATAFQVQNATSQAALNVDTSTNSVYIDYAGLNNGVSTANSLRFGANGSGEGIASKRTATGNQYGLDFFVGNADVFKLTNNGNAAFRNRVDDAAAFQVQNSAYTSIFNVNTTGNGAVTLGSNSLSANVLNGDLTGGQTIQGQTLNASSMLRTGGTNRLEGDGDLVNIGNFTSTAGTLFSSTGANGFTFKPGTNNASAFVIQNANSQNLFQVDSTGGNITLNGVNSGETGAWTTESDLLTSKRRRGAAVIANGYAYVLGGDNGASTSTVYYTKLNTDGSTGAWQSTTSLPAIRSQLSTVVSNGYIYAIGGSTDSIDVQSTVYYAKLNSDGTVGSWQTSSNSITATRYHSSVSSNGYVYVIGGQNSIGSSVATVQYAKLNADGSTGAWTTTNSLPNTRYLHSSVVANGYVYAIAGYDGSTVQSTVFYAKLNSNGTTGTWQSTNSIVGARYLSGAVVVNGHVYMLGGFNGTSYLNSVTYAPLNGDGTTGTWVTSANTLPLLVGYYGGVGTANGYIYTFGGNNASDIRNEVNYASVSRLKIGGVVDLVGLSGENMAEGGTGGELTAGNTNVIGTLQVQGPASFMQTMSVDKELRVGGNVLFQNTTNATDAFQILNSSGTSIFDADTTNSRIGIGIKDPESLLHLRSGGDAVLRIDSGTGPFPSNSSSIQFRESDSYANGWNMGYENSSNDFFLQSVNSTTTGTTTPFKVTRENGQATFKNNADTTSAFQILTAATSNAITLLNADTSGLVLTIGGNTTSFATLRIDNAHFKSTQTNAPTIGTPTNCGTTPTAAVQTGGTDSAGAFRVTAGTVTPTTCDTVITFNKAYGAAPKSVMVAAQTKDGGTGTAAARQLYVSGTSTTTFTVKMNSAPAASEVNWYYYWVVE